MSQRAKQTSQFAGNFQATTESGDLDLVLNDDTGRDSTQKTTVGVLEEVSRTRVHRCSGEGLRGQPDSSNSWMGSINNISRMSVNFSSTGSAKG